MKKNALWKKLFACLLTGTLVAGCLSGCGKQQVETKPTSESESKVQESSSSVQESSQPKEEVTLTIAWPEEINVTAHATDLSETAFGKAWQEATGINIEIMQLADTQAFNLMFAGGDLPDIIWYSFAQYPGGVQAAIEDGIIEPLNDYMEFCPNLKAVLDKKDIYWGAVTTNAGNIAGFPFIRDDSNPGALATGGFMTRRDWLEDLGLEEPKSADDFYNMLKAFKEEKGCEYPLTSLSAGHFFQAAFYGYITSPFNLPQGDFYQLDGKVHYGCAEPEYKDVLVWLNKLYNEGLLDPNFSTMDQSTFDANITNGYSAVGVAGSNTPNRLTTAAVETNPDFDLVGIAPLCAPNEDISMCGSYSYPISGMYAVITPNCENKEAACKLLDYAYSEEGTMLFNYGIEGESYEIVDGKVVKTDIFTNHPDGWTESEVRAYYERNWDSGPMLHLNITDGQPERTITTKANWSKSNIEQYKLPQLTFSDEVNTEISKFNVESYTYVYEMFIKFIMGTESLDNYDDYVNTLKNEMKLDKVLEYHQEALDAYYAK